MFQILSVGFRLAVVLSPLFQIRYVLGPQKGGGFILGLIRYSSCKSGGCSHLSLVVVRGRRFLVSGLCSRVLVGVWLPPMVFVVVLFCFLGRQMLVLWVSEMMDSCSSTDVRVRGSFFGAGLCCCSDLDPDLR